MTQQHILRATLMVATSLILIFAAMTNTVYAEQATTAAAPHANASTLTGKVTEIINVTGYTYAEVNLGKTKVWAAGPVTALKTGDEVSFTTAMPMQNFHSKTMKRDFELLYFVGTFNLANQATATSPTGKMPSSHPALPKTMPSPHAELNNASAATPLKGIKKVKGGQTIADLLANKTKLKGKTVELRGKVTKVTNNVMGKNWLHIRDSSTLDDLTLTTKDNAVIDDVVVVKGKLELDQDFSYGYVYPVIVLDAKIAKE